PTRRRLAAAAGRWTVAVALGVGRGGHRRGDEQVGQDRGRVEVRGRAEVDVVTDDRAGHVGREREAQQEVQRLGQVVAGLGELAEDRLQGLEAGQRVVA